MLLPSEKFASSRDEIDQVALSNRGRCSPPSSVGLGELSIAGCVTQALLTQPSASTFDPSSLPHDIRLVFRLPSLFPFHKHINCRNLTPPRRSANRPIISPPRCCSLRASHDHDPPRPLRLYSVFLNLDSQFLMYHAIPTCL